MTVKRLELFGANFTNRFVKVTQFSIPRLLQLAARVLDGDQVKYCIRNSTYFTQLVSTVSCIIMGNRKGISIFESSLNTLVRM